MGLRQFCLGVLILLLGVSGGQASIRFDAAADFLSRSTGVPAFGNLTRMYWLYRVVDQASDEIISYIADTSSQAIYIGTYADAGSAALHSEMQGLGTSSNGTTLTLALATWVHIAQVFNDTANTMDIFINGALQAAAQAAGQTGSTTWGYELFANGASGGGNPSNARLAGFKEFTAVLSAAEITSEMAYFAPVRRANLHSWSPFWTATNLASYVGGATWTAAGTLTTEADPPLKGGVTPGNGFLTF